MRMTRRIVCLIASTVLAAACGPAGMSDRPDSGGGDNEFIDAAPPMGCSKMDFVFVIDDSGSMSEEQQNLATNFPQFIQVINDYVTHQGLPLDYRIAITSAGRDVSYSIEILPGVEIPFVEQGLNGAFVQRCGMTRPWLQRTDANLSSTFACAAELGVSGPGAEMPLLGLDWSLSRRMDDGTNAGFLRDDALLAVVMITDQDDCSREDDNFVFSGSEPTCFNPQDPGIIPLADYLGFLDTLTGARDRWASAVIAGPGPGSCTSAFGDAAEAVRMKDFVTQAGTNSVFSSICDGDLATALGEAVAQFEVACTEFPPVE